MELSTILQDRFGLEALHPLQERVIAHVMAGGDAMIVAPTGSGKSLCYQLPALALPGPGFGLVFSPLIALMEDQVSSLRRRGIRAQYVNSTVRKAERTRRYARIAEGAYELVYVTPERMTKPDFLEALEQARAAGHPVKLLAIDEMHCVSKWGHDLRPAYREVGHFREVLGSPVTLGLTATATPAVRADVRHVLDRDEESMPLFAEPVDRPNLSLEVETVWSDDEKVEKIRAVASAMGGTGIVYFTLIKDLDRMSALIRRAMPDRKIAIYHGRLDGQEKKRVYDRFTAATPEDGLLLLATNAFGMGVDKPDIRFIVHAQVPGSLEAYHQEVGRAGRDGRPSRCVLLYAQDDLAIQQEFVEWMNPPADLIRRAVHAIEAHPHADLDVDELSEDLFGRKRTDRRLEYAVIALDHLGVTEPSPTKGRFRMARRLDEHELDPEELQAKKQRDLSRLLDVVQLVQAGDPRETVRAYFHLEEG